MSVGKAMLEQVNLSRYCGLWIRPCWNRYTFNPPWLWISLCCSSYTPEEIAARAEDSTWSGYTPKGLYSVAKSKMEQGQQEFSAMLHLMVLSKGTRVEFVMEIPLNCKLGFELLVMGITVAETH